MFKESLSGDASSNLDPSEEVTLYKIKKPFVNCVKRARRASSTKLKKKYIPNLSSYTLYNFIVKYSLGV